jgi:hypothetical protein
MKLLGQILLAILAIIYYSALITGVLALVDVYLGLFEKGYLPIFMSLVTLGLFVIVAFFSLILFGKMSDAIDDL